MNASENPTSRPLSDFTVELDVYSGPYEWLLALILKDEVEIFEIPLKELVDLYLKSRETSPSTERSTFSEAEVFGNLERDAEFASSASALVLLKSRTLSPLFEPEPGEEEDGIPPEELARRLSLYLKVRRGAEGLRSRLEENHGFYPSGHELRPRPGKLRVDRERVTLAARRVFSRMEEPTVSHLGEISVTVQELVSVIKTALGGGKVSYEDLTRDMDRLHAAVTFAAALSLASEGSITLAQGEPLGPLTLEPTR